MNDHAHRIHCVLHNGLDSQPPGYPGFEEGQMITACHTIHCRHYDLARGAICIEQAARIIRNHYKLPRPVTEDEAWAEVANIERRRDNASLDDMYYPLAAALKLI